MPPFWDSFASQIQCEDVYFGDTMSTLKQHGYKDFFSGVLSKVKDTGTTQVLWEAVIDGNKTYFVTSSSEAYGETMAFFSDDKGIIAAYDEVAVILSPQMHEEVAEETYLKLERGL